MQYDLKNKVILTGGNSGIGKAASIQLARLGRNDCSGVNALLTGGETI